MWAKTRRQEFRDRRLHDLIQVAITGHYSYVEPRSLSRLCDYLSAAPAGRDNHGAIRRTTEPVTDDGDRAHLEIARRIGTREGAHLGANAQSVGGILKVAASKNMPRASPHRSPDGKARIRGVGTLRRIAR